VSDNSVKLPATKEDRDYTKLIDLLVNTIRDEIRGRDLNQEELSSIVITLVDKKLAQANITLPEDVYKKILKEINNDIIGYGPIQKLLDDPSISEIMVNGPNNVYIERKGRLESTNVRFNNDEHVMRIINRIVLPLGRRIDEENPTVDARLPDGSRVNAVIPPVSIDGPTITIRKFAKDRLGIPDLIRFGSITQTVATFFEACVKARLNILISGGTGSGKTTLLNILSSYIQNHDRIVTIEDAAELQLQQDHVVRLETIPENVDGRGEVDIRHLVKNSLRMRPDRIIVGECRSGEALDMLQAMNTGHDGSLTTIHANTPRDCLSRLETLVLMAGMSIPVKVIRGQVASAIDLIIQQSRMPDGSRKITYVTEVSGMEGDTIVMSDIFKFEIQGTNSEGKVIGELRATGIRPLFMERISKAGFPLGPSIFMPPLSKHNKKRR
jgi:pilus assembly protein CpaF